MKLHYEIGDIVDRSADNFKEGNEGKQDLV